jgi:hypothetical protein
MGKSFKDRRSRNEGNLQLTDLYAEYYYKAAIKQTVDEKIGTEPNRDLLRYVEGN